MRARLPALLAIAALTLAACHRDRAEDKGQAAAAAGWVTHVEATPEGGMRMGNPNARAKLVEYASYTCPHCAAFQAEATPTIRQWVAAGKLSYEMRNFIRDSFDLSAALLARCGGPRSFFPLSDQIFAAQQEWIGNAQNMTPADAKKIDALPPAEQLYQISRVTGLNGFAGQQGLTPDRVHACLVDQGAWQRLAKATQVAESRDKVDGTPTFLLDGKPVGSPDWQGLKPDLAAAVGD